MARRLLTLCYYALRDPQGCAAFLVWANLGRAAAIGLVPVLALAGSSTS